MPSQDSEPRGYEGLYQTFDSPLMRRLREQAYGRDIGQHSWVTAEELLEELPRLSLSSASRLLDLGCGPGGPLSFVAGESGCRGTGVDVSGAAVAAAMARAQKLGLAGSLEFRQADLDQPLPFGEAAFDAAIALDVVLHVRDRAGLFREAARVLAPGAPFLFTDAGVITGSVSDEEIRLRCLHGHTRFVPPGFNERLLGENGWDVVDTRDRTAGLLANAAGRLEARLAHRAEVEAMEGAEGFERQRLYLATVVALSRRGAVSRMSYLARRRKRA